MRLDYNFLTMLPDAMANLTQSRAFGNKDQNKTANPKLAALNAAKFALHVIKQGGLAAF